MALDITDKTSNNNDLTNSGATESADTPFAGSTAAADLEVTESDYLSIADASQTGLDISEDITIEFWVKQETLPGGYVLSKWDINAQRSYGVAITTLGKIEAYFSSNGTFDAGQGVTYGTTDAVISAGTYAHVAITLDLSAESCIFYVNGASVASSQLAGTTIGANLHNGTAPFAIGCRFGTGVATAFNDGLIDEVRIWNDVRTSTEVADNYAIELVGNEANLVAYYPFEEAFPGTTTSTTSSSTSTTTTSTSTTSSSSSTSTTSSSTSTTSSSSSTSTTSSSTSTTTISISTSTTSSSSSTSTTSSSTSTTSSSTSTTSSSSSTSTTSSSTSTTTTSSSSSTSTTSSSTSTTSSSSSSSTSTTSSSTSTTTTSISTSTTTTSSSSSSSTSTTSSSSTSTTSISTSSTSSSSSTSTTQTIPLEFDIFEEPRVFNAEKEE